MRGERGGIVTLEEFIYYAVTVRAPTSAAPLPHQLPPRTSCARWQHHVGAARSCPPWTVALPEHFCFSEASTAWAAPSSPPHLPCLVVVGQTLSDRGTASISRPASRAGRLRGTQCLYRSRGDRDYALCPAHCFMGPSAWERRTRTHCWLGCGGPESRRGEHIGLALEVAVALSAPPPQRPQPLPCH